MTTPSTIYAGYAHAFDVGIACELGINAAIIFNHIVYWLRFNAAKPKVEFIEEKIWMYETQEDIANSLGYLSLEEVKKACVKLVESGLLIKANHDPNKFNKTNWYTTFDQSIIWKGIKNSKNPYESAIRRDRERPRAPSNEPQGAMYNTVQKEHAYKEQQHDGGCGSSDSEKIKAMETINLNGQTMQRAFRFSLEEIKVAIACCLNAGKPIDNLDGYFMTALTEKWQPKPTKLDKAKAEALKEKEQQQQRQQEAEEIQRQAKKVYLEAKQLELAYKHKMTEEHRFSVTENCISMRIEVKGFNGRVADNRPLTEGSLEILKEYIKLNLK